FFNALCIILVLGLITSCKDTDKDDNTIDPFNNGSNQRNMIVVISDLHLGPDLAYTECKNNLKALEKLLYKIKNSANVKELVIAGDMLDEWFVPANIDTYNGQSQANYVQRIATTNKGVIDAFNAIIQEGKILVTYVPGNHDLTITEENISLILPGINQARDTSLGLGTYVPNDLPILAIEHGHRYNFFCAPDPISNQTIAPGSITPPGYFFTRIAALHVAQECTIAGDTIPELSLNTTGGESQTLLYAYWKLWQWAINALPIENKFDEELIVTNINGFSGNFSVNDLIPFQLTNGGEIDVNLFKGIQDSWNQRQALNNVPVNIPTLQAIKNSASSTESDNQAKTQYFLNPNSNTRIVIFGHSHDAKVIASTNTNGQKTIYANSGTWVDHNNVAPTTTNFVVITPQTSDASSKTYVKLYNYMNETVTKMSEDSMRY
ncbi:MAG: metallophosphoesterase, partial [Bacteroidales bacterium]|nr:metallophosphoesterase [Bacteroidales bacterium]